MPSTSPVRSSDPRRCRHRLGPGRRDRARCRPGPGARAADRRHQRAERRHRVRARPPPASASRAPGSSRCRASTPAARPRRSSSPSRPAEGRRSSSSRGSTTSSATESPSAASSGSGTRRGRPNTTTVNLGARAGFNQGLNEHVSFWPTIGIDGSYTHTNDSNSTAALEVFAPFLYHVAPHFFLGAGPFLSYLVKGGPDTRVRPRLRHRRLALRRAASPEARAATSALRTASASALRVPTSTTRRLPRVTAV